MSQGISSSCLCACGCGLPTPLARKTSARDKTIKGQPTRFFPHHRSPLAPKKLDKPCADCGGVMIRTKASARRCLECQDANRRVRDQKGKRLDRMKPEYRERYREYSLGRRYGLTLKRVAEMIEEQGGGCAICGSTDSKWKRDWHVDHDHARGMVRGILCRPCNLLLGTARDNVETLRRAAEYLEKFLVSASNKNEVGDKVKDAAL